jgi:hypothetical protein
MALPAQPATAAEMAASLRNSHGSFKELVFRPAMYAAMQAWTPGDRDEVQTAAQQNTSVRGVSIDIADMSDETAEILSCIVSRLDHVVNFTVDNTGGCRPSTDAVDTLLQGVRNSRSPVKLLQIYAGCSPPALLEFAERFPDLQVLADAGQCPCGSCPDHGEFSLALAVAIGPVGPFHPCVKLSSVFPLVPPLHQSFCSRCSSHRQSKIYS